jgi:hypothetical protein
MWFEIFFTTLGNLRVFGAAGRSVVAIPKVWFGLFLRQSSEKTKILSLIGEVDIVRRRTRPGDNIFICVGHGCAGAIKRMLIQQGVIQVALVMDSELRCNCRRQ